MDIMNIIRYLLAIVFAWVSSFTNTTLGMESGGAVDVTDAASATGFKLLFDDRLDLSKLAVLSV